MRPKLETHRPTGGIAWHWSPLPHPAGYRALDFPWYSSSVHSPWYRTRPWVSYLPGFTIRVIRHAKVYDQHMVAHPRRWHVSIRTSGRSVAYPAWW